MSLAGAAINRPVLTSLIFLIVTVLGLFGLGLIPIDLMPEMTYPILSVRTSYPNTSPYVVEEQITIPLERALAAVPGVKELTSYSYEGSSVVILEFNWGQDLTEAISDTRDRVDRALPGLPDDLERPTLRKYDAASQDIMVLGVASPLHPVELKSLIKTDIANRLERSPGVASAEGQGGLEREIRVEVDEATVKALSLDLASIATVIGRENRAESGGEIERGRLGVSLRSQGEFVSLEDLKGLALVNKPGQGLIRLKDIARITDSWAKVNSITRVNGQAGQFIRLFKQSGANTVKTVSEALKSVKAINDRLASVDIRPIFDSSTHIKKSIRAITEAILVGGFLAVALILFFLQNIKSALVLALSIPISIIATFLALYFGGLSLNVITMGALALGVGMMVDNSIVVLDNIYRLRAEGLSAKEASRRGADVLAGAVVASTLTTISVFLPIAFLNDLTGEIFRPFCWAIAFSLICSLVVSLTLTPMMASLLLKNAGESRILASGSRVSFGEPRYFRSFFKGFELGYLTRLTWALKKPGATILLALFLLALSLALIPRLGTEFMAKTDESEFSIWLKLEPGTTVNKTSAAMALIEAIVEEFTPEKVLTATTVSGGSASLRVKLLEVSKRSRSVFEIVDSLRPKLINLPGGAIEIYVSNQSPSLHLGGGDSAIQIELLGDDVDRARRLTREIKKVIEKIPGIADIHLSNEETTPEQVIVIDRERAADIGVTAESVNAIVRTAAQGQTAGYYREKGHEYPIRVTLKDYESISLERLLNLPVATRSGAMTPISNVVTVKEGRAPQSITRRNQARAYYVYASISGRSLGSVAKDLEKALVSLPLGQDFTASLVGEVEDQAKTFKNLTKILALSVFLLYSVMAGQFEGFRGPLVIMASIPFAAIGVIWAHFLTNTSFNVNSYIGLIILAGVVVNNAIILIDQANSLIRKEGWELTPALLETGKRRLRPIMMTTLTTILGLIPMAMGFGEGGETQAPLGRTVIGGLASSTFITLFLVPVVYQLFFRKKSSPTKNGL
ncbi:MAG: efflux RND transporter permease subunit [Deltaproteobacteria bacterium]|jgi:HAE1 family hydrophobic/amphiphilic exporter-1|nr:efflux RND transporter permease subunit [Deltaproteobacteria bacterium]